MDITLPYTSAGCRRLAVKMSPALPVPIKVFKYLGEQVNLSGRVSSYTQGLGTVKAKAFSALPVLGFFDYFFLSVNWRFQFTFEVFWEVSMM